MADTADPLAGSYVVEALTDEIERRAFALIDEVEALGGSVAAIERGYVQDQIGESAYAWEQAVESGERRIVGVEFDGDAFPALNNVKWMVSSDGAEVGKVTSAIYSPRLEKNIGFAWVPKELAEPGSSLKVATEWGDRGATVVEMPFVDPKKTIPIS